MESLGVGLRDSRLSTPVMNRSFFWNRRTGLENENCEIPPVLFDGSFFGCPSSQGFHKDGGPGIGDNREGH